MISLEFSIFDTLFNKECKQLDSSGDSQLETNTPIFYYSLSSFWG